MKTPISEKTFTCELRNSKFLTERPAVVKEGLYGPMRPKEHFDGKKHGKADRTRVKTWVLRTDKDRPAAENDIFVAEIDRKTYSRNIVQIK